MTEIFVFLTVVVICATVLVWKALDLLVDGVNICSLFKKKEKKPKKNVSDNQTWKYSESNKFTKKTVNEVSGK